MPLDALAVNAELGLENMFDVGVDWVLVGWTGGLNVFWGGALCKRLRFAGEAVPKAPPVVLKAEFEGCAGESEKAGVAEPPKGPLGACPKAKGLFSAGAGDP